MSPPFEFSNSLARWVGKWCVSGVVFIEFVPTAERVEARLNKLRPLLKGDKEAAAKRKKDSGVSSYATGFLVHRDNHGIYVLTCAHALEPMFDAENDLTADEAQELYEPQIVCDHRELRFRTGLDEARRVARGAAIYQLNCSRDLMLIRIQRFYFERLYCRQHHSILRIAQNFPAPLQRVVMVSWPVLRHRTMVTGEVSHRAQNHNDLARENPQNYQMLLSEVRISSDPGSSGAPLVDGEVEVIGVLHGGQGSFSYFISLPDIIQTLVDWGILGDH